MSPRHVLSRFAFLLSVLVLGSVVAAALRADDPKEKDKSKDDSWIYRSKEHSFSLKLPSSRWKEIGKGKGLAAFHNGFPFPMTVGVLSMTKESLDEYKDSVKKLLERVKKDEANLLAKMEFVEKVTDAGNHRSFAQLKEKGQMGEEYIFVGISHTWIKKQSTTIVVLFEGVGHAKSRLFKAQEQAAFEAAAKAICLSVE